MKKKNKEERPPSPRRPPRNNTTNNYMKELSWLQYTLLFPIAQENEERKRHLAMILGDQRPPSPPRQPPRQSSPARPPSNRTNSINSTNSRTNSRTNPRLLRKADFTKLVVPGDGDCMFSSAAAAQLIEDGLGGVWRQLFPGMAAEMRAVVADYIAKHPADFSGFMTYNPRTLNGYSNSMPAARKVKNYVNAIRRPGVYGGDVELRALAIWLERDVAVYREVTGDGAHYHLYTVHKPLRPPREPTPPLRLLYNQVRLPSGMESGHFDPLIRRGLL